ncbi:MAG: hypothetical protein IJD77_01000 [Clostridia bacterium]|nr:hypothetical protein [Clostridia bacterium]
MKNDWIDYNAPDEWYNPSKGWRFVGNVAEGVGGMLPAVAVSFIPGAGPALSTAAFATQAAGQSTSEAVKKTGELGGKEWLYGTASGAAEAAIEKASGGIGGSKVGQVFGKQLGKTTAGKIGVSFVSEGLEEVASDLLDPGLQRVTGVDKNAKWDLKGLPKTFAVGGATGAVMGALGTGVSAVAEGGINNVRARENAEELSNRLSDNNVRQAKGKKAIYTEKDIADTTQRVSDSLRKMKEKDRAAFFVKHARIGQFFNEDGSIKQIDGVKSDALNSYDNEAYSASLHGREGAFAYKPVSKSVKATEEAQIVMRNMELITNGKADIVLTDESFGTTSSGKPINGLVQDGIIYLNAKATDFDKANFIASHEVIHTLEGTQEYQDLQSFVKAQIQSDPTFAEQYSLEKYLARYAGAQSQQYSNATRTYEAETEIIADFLANEVLSKPDVVNRLVNRNRNIVIRMLEWVRSAIKRLGMSKQERGEYEALRKMERYLAAALDAGTGGVKLSDVEKAYQKREQEMAQESQEAQEKPVKQVTGKLAEARFSIQNIDGEDIVVIDTDQDIFEGKEKSDYPKIVRQYLLDKFRDKVLPVGSKMAYIKRESLKEYAYPADRRTDADIKAAKMKAGTELDNLLKTAKFFEHQRDDGRHPDAVRGWDKYKTQFIVDGRKFEGEVSIKLTQRGDVFYDMTKIKDITSGTNGKDLSSQSASRRSDAIEGRPSTTIIREKTEKSTQNAKKVEKRFSIDVDSEGNSLSAEQQEFFKDSKVRDKNGNLLVVYHQTADEFTQFDTKREGAGQSDHETPSGIFLKPTSKDIGLKGKRQMQLYANITNPKRFYDRDMARRHWENNIEGYSDIIKKMSENDSVFGEKFENAFNSDMPRAEYLRLSKEERARIDKEAEEREDAILSEWRQANGKLDKQAKRLINEYLRKSGYDGVFLTRDIGSFGRVVETFIALDPEQVKNTTNKNPTKNPDIRFSIDIDNFDPLSYNEIQLSTQERNRLHSEAMTWDKDRNKLVTRTLANGYIYRYVLDDNYDLHVYEKEKAQNFHELGVNYDKQTRTRPDNAVQSIRVGQANNNRSIGTLQDGRESSKADTGDNRKVRSEGRSDGAGYSKNGVDANRTQERKRIVYYDASNKDGNRRLSISDSLEAKYPSLDLDQDISGIYKAPAVKLNDGSIVPFSIVKDRPKYARYHPAIPSTTAEQTLFIQQNKIAAKDLESVGWIVNGQYNVTRAIHVATARRVTEPKVKVSTKERSEQVKDRAKKTWVTSQMAFTNDVAGLEDAGDHLGINLRPKVQRARSSKAAALNMIANKQADRNGNVVGDSLADIFNPIIQSNKKRTRKENDAYTADFYEYLLHYLNEDRMSMEANAQKEMQALAQKHKSIRDLLNQGLEEDDLRHYLKKTEEGKKYVQLMDVKNKPVFTRSDSVVQVTAEESKQRREELEKAHPEFKEHAEKVWKYNKNLLQRRVDAGLLTQAQADDLNKRYPHYVPTFRDMEGAPGTGTSGTKRTNYQIEVKKTIKTAKGSDLDILDISLMMAKQTQQVLQAEAQNEIANALYDAAVEKNDFRDVAVVKVEDLQDALNESQEGDIDYGMERPKDKEVVFYKDGQRITMAVSPLVFESLQALNPAVASETSSNILARALRGMIKAFKALVTSWNPLFSIANTVRDLQEAIFYTKNGKLKFFGTYWKNFVSFRKQNNELWQKYLAMGGATSSFFNNETGVYDRRGKVRKGLGKIFGVIEKVNWYIEQIPRFTEFALSVKAGKSLDQALLDSADVTTNFSRGGKVTKIANSLFMPFLNPSVQGWSKLYRTFAEPISGMSKVGITNLTKTAEGRKALKQFGGLIVKSVIVGIAVGLFNDLLYDDDEDYANISQNIKDNYYLFKVGDKFIRIPKGRVVALFGSVADRIKSSIEGEDVSFSEWFDSASQMVSPVESATRTFFSPFTDVKTNTTWYGGEIESQRLQSFAPSQRYDEGTSSIAIFLGDVFNYSPKKIHYLIDQYTGVIGDVILPMTTQKAERDMFSNRFVVDPVLQNNISTEFYSLLDEAMYAKNAGDPTAALTYRYLSQVSNSVSDMYQQKREIEKSNLSDNEKQKQTRVIQALINETLLSASEGVENFEQLLIDSGYEDAAAKLLNDGAFKKFDEKQQTSAAQKLTDYYYAKAFSNLNDEKYAIKYYLYDELGGANAAIYLTDIASIESDKDKSGKTIANSRKNKVHAYIEKLRLSAKQKYMLMYLAGYAPSETGKTQIKTYLKTKGFSEEDMETLF